MIDYEKWVFALGVGITLWALFTCISPTVRFFEWLRNRKNRNRWED